MTDYKPGTVAKATVRGVPDQRVMRHKDGGWFSVEYADGFRHHRHLDVTDVRPLVVLDLKSANPDSNPEILFENTLRALRKYGTVGTRGIARQIEEQTRPAIEEPGLWGVVRDTAGEVWVCTEPHRWTRILDGVEWPWVDIDNPEVVREGVQP